VLKNSLFVMDFVDTLYNVYLKIRARSILQALVKCSKCNDCMAYGGNVVALLQHKSSPEAGVEEAR